MRDYTKKNEPADDSKIKGFVNAYNNTIHNETGLSPNEMQNNKTLEVNISLIKYLNKLMLKINQGIK
jgi:hypothetical protein